jgi:hypothetical protein
MFASSGKNTGFLKMRTNLEEMRTKKKTIIWKMFTKPNLSGR